MQLIANFNYFSFTLCFFFFSSRRRHTRSLCDWSSDVCSSDLKQGLQFGEVYQTLQSFLGGAYVNQFNRFGRQWKVYLQAEPQYRNSSDQINNFYVRNSKSEMTPLGSLVTIRRVSGPEYTNRFNLYRSIQINGSP